MAGPTPPDPAYVEQLSAVVRALVDLLSAYGYASEADWLQARLPEISEADKTPEGVADIQGKLHRVIPGMGGLTDIFLRGESDEATQEANAELRRLTKLLWELTR